MTAQVKKRTELALEGGTPVRSTLLPYARQKVEEHDVQAVVEVLRSDWLTTGPQVAEFEEAFAARVGARHAVSLSSGTAALHAACFAAGLGPGDEAITSPLTFCATANAVLYQQATPVFADVTPDTLNLDPDQVRAHLAAHTKAILPVDYAGHPAELERLMEIARARGLTVIEDACHALGARYRDRSVGSIADLTVFSFHPVKHITTGEGGMVTTNHAGLAERLWAFRNHGITRDPRRQNVSARWEYEMTELGYNYRLSDVACALGASQLQCLEANLARRRQIAAMYTEAFRRIEGVIPPAVRQDVTPAWHLYPIRMDLERLSVGRAEVYRALRAENIGVAVHYIPVHYHPYYRERFGDRRGQYPITEGAYESLLSLPMFHAMTDQDVEDVMVAVEKVVRYYEK
ncbi:MAG: UDP-4-amino-4,6-dideoxy-N-acetyl-beta-L-altrosamine transaminase [Terriglobales bacterium]